MLVERPVVGIVTLRVDVVEKQPDPDAAIGSLEHLVGEQPAGQVALPVIVLQVETSLGTSRGGGAQREGLDVVGEEPQPGLLRVLRQKRRDRRVELGPGVRDGKRRRRRSRPRGREPAVERDRGHNCKDQNCEDRPPHRRSVSSFHRPCAPGIPCAKPLKPWRSVPTPKAGPRSATTVFRARRCCSRTGARAWPLSRRAARRPACRPASRCPRRRGPSRNCR